MAKTLVYVPRMFTREEFKEVVGEVSEDFDRTAKEFWNYVSEKLLVNKVARTLSRMRLLKRAKQQVPHKRLF